MGAFMKGDVVVLPFPFSDLTQTKRRPALVLAELDFGDLILCQITSQSSRDLHAIALASSDFESGSLQVTSFVRPTRVFAADSRIVLYKVGKLKQAKCAEIVGKLIAVLQA